MCCRSLSTIVRMAELGDPDSIFYRAAKEFPYSWDESGCCEMLENNLCSVYEDRPLLCNVKKISELYSQETGVSVQDIYGLNARICNSLINAANLDESFMIDPNQFK
jgi:Fe-S-cluster containining protein